MVARDANARARLASVGGFAAAPLGRDDIGGLLYARCEILEDSCPWYGLVQSTWCAVALHQVED